MTARRGQRDPSGLFVRPDNLDALPFADTADPDPDALPFVAAGHPDDEPPRDGVTNGDPCKACGQPIYLERRRTGDPMHWIHRDESPACPVNLSPHVNVPHHYGPGEWPGWSS